MSPILFRDRKEGKEMKIAYPAIVHDEEENSCWVEFPDLEGCFSDGDSVAAAVLNAEEALGAYLCSLEERGIEIPPASDYRTIRADVGVVTLVATDPAKYHRSTRAVKKTLTIPEWLNVEAEKRHINFSSVLQQALIAAIE